MAHPTPKITKTALLKLNDLLITEFSNFSVSIRSYYVQQLIRLHIWNFFLIFPILSIKQTIIITCSVAGIIGANINNITALP